MAQTARERIFVFGASGHGKVVIDAIERQGVYEVAFLVDDNKAMQATTFFGYPVIGGKTELLAAPEDIRRGIVAIGDNCARGSVAGWLAANGFGLVTVVHPSAQLGRGVLVGEGTVVMAGAVVNTDAVLGRNVIVNTRASVDHDCTIADGVHLAPGSTLCGTVDIGEQTFICAGAVVIPNLRVGRRVTVAAGSVVIGHLPDELTVAGVPARVLKKEGTDHA